MEEVSIEYDVGKNYLKRKVLEKSSVNVLNPKKLIDAMQSVPGYKVKSEKEKLSEVTVWSIEGLTNEENRALKDVLPRATKAWKESESSELKIKDFLIMLLKILGQEIAELELSKRNSLSLQQPQRDHKVLLKGLHDRVSDMLGKNKNNVYDDSFTEKILVNILTRKEYHSLALILITQLTKPHDIVKAEQGILNTMLLKAIEKDRRDMALLLICNGASIIEVPTVIAKLGDELLGTKGVEQVARLYNKMPTIGVKCKKIKEGESRINRELEIIDFTVKSPLDRNQENDDEEVLEIREIFNLKELSELFPEGSLLKVGSDITMSYNEKISSGKLKRTKGKKDSGQEDKAENLESITQYLEKKERNKLLRNWSLGGAGLGGAGGACAFFFLAPPIAAFVFAGVAVGSIAVSLLASGGHILINKQGDLEISRDNLQDLNKAIDLFIDLLKQNVPSGISNTFLEELRQEKEEISKEKFINLSRISDVMKRVCKKIPGVDKLISEIKEKKWKDIELIMLLLEDFEREFNKAVAESSKVKEVTFGDLAMNITRSRENYIMDLKRQSVTDEQNDTTNKLGIVAREISDMLIDLSNAEVKRIAQDKEEERQGREEAEAREKARDLVYIKAYEFKIPMETIIQNQDIRELLTQQYALLVLNTDYVGKFKDICNKYKDFRKELKSKQSIGKEEFDKLSKLNDEFNRADKNFVQREHKENESARKFDDEAISELRSHVIAEIKRARADAEQEKKALIEEKNAVEEVVMQLQMSDSVQMQLPSSAFSSVSHESVAGPSWQI
ncbi:hypothetical protein [Wolbachia endosymbiont (group A) of Therophilus tumidulus]|uniref:hypothetical protein n=1 Tax=Wolbachia endosymbiont (group A) of Therophilus tumidulus TaxID=3066214 RepID=UPI00376EF525